MKRVVNFNDCTMERVCSVILFAAGTVFLFMALFGAWKYFFTMAVCYAAGILVREDIDKEKDGRK